MTEKKQQFKEVVSRVNVSELEKDVLTYWEKEDIFHQSLEQNKDKERFTFYDGPPYATGKPHYGHILQSAIKDTVLRYKTMRGYYVPRRVGWDCHGLPVETLVEKEVGFKTKRDIEEYGIEKFNNKCRDTVFRYIDDFTNTLKRMGRWADYENAYATLNRGYMETEWWVFKKLWDQRLVYKAFRSTPYCVRCATPLSNFEVTINYKDTKDTAVYVGLEVVGENNLYLLVWTTTPWTLPGNVAVALGKDIKYVSVKSGDKEFILAEDRVKQVLGEEAEIVKKWDNKQLEGMKYKPLYPEVTKKTREGKEKGDKLFGVVESDHVTVEDGTGLVHIAPAFGEEDAAVGKKYGLPTLRTVDTSGNMTEEVGQWAGQNIFQVNEKVVADLEERGLLLKSEQYKHSYPYCWRCETPLIYYALDSWFIKINGSGLKERMLAAAEKIEWTPKHVKKGRFWKGIESAPDWAVSRNRFWSVPMPVWVCNKCDRQVCVGSVEELKKLSGAKEEQVKDIHRPYVDEVAWQCECGGKMTRVEEVLDVWFDAGSMPYAQSHYPFENRALVKKGFPADFIVEMIEQTRLWFYVLHVLALALTSKEVKDEVGLGEDLPAFRNAVGSGLIFAEDGRKLSKKLKNYPEPEPTIERYGADVLRLYLLSSASLGEPYRFAEKDLRKLQSNVYMTLWNVYSFFVRYANTHGWTKEQVGKQGTMSSDVLDRWIVARLKQFEYEVITKTEEYQVDDASRAIAPFIDDLSNWYVRRSRDRFQRPTKECSNEAFATLYFVLVRTAKILAPYMPFVGEVIYRNLTGEESVHLTRFDEAVSLSEEEKKLVADVASARMIVKEGLALRAAQGIKVRQPLNGLVVMREVMASELVEMIRDEVNVKKVQFVTELLQKEKGYVVSDEGSKVTVALNVEISDELKREGLAREIVRHGQVLRREAGYALDDRIKLVFVTESQELQQVMTDNREYILEALQVDKVIEEKEKTDKGVEIEINGQKVYLGVQK